MGTETLHRHPSSIRLDKNDEEIKEQQYTVIEKYSIYEHIIQIEYNVRNVNKYELISYNRGVSVLKYVCTVLIFLLFKDLNVVNLNRVARRNTQYQSFAEVGPLQRDTR